MATNQQIPQTTTTTTKTKKSQTVRQIELLFMLKRQVNIVYKQLNHFESAMKNVAQFNRFMSGYVYVDCNNNNNQEEESNSKRLQIEFNKFQKNYRFWRKRLRKFDRKLREINLYDKLYDLYENLIIGDCDEPIAIEDLIDDIVAESTIVSEPAKCSDNLPAKEEIPVFVISDSEDDTEEFGHEVLISENDIEVKLDTPEMETFQLPEKVTNSQKTKLLSAPPPPPSSSTPEKIQIVPSEISTIKKSTTEKSKISVRKPPKVVKGITLPASTSSDANLEFNKVANPLNYSRQVGRQKKKDKKKKKKNSPIGVVVESIKLAADKELAIYDRPYKCNFNGCNFAAKTIHNLKSHQISHSDDRPHRCDHPGCGFAAKLSNVLKRHRLTHSDSKPYSCDHCCKRFKHFNSFRVHLELHQFPCEIDGCQHSFRDYNKLLQHIGAIHAKHAARLDIANLNLFDGDGCQMILD